jgi:predicted O-methyltransferase YrrM
MIITKAVLSSALKEVPFIHEAEIPVLCGYASGARQEIVEIGTGFGGSTVLWLLYSQARVSTIDPFVQDSQGTWCATYERAHGAILRALSELAGNTRALERLVMYCMPSDQAAQHWNNAIDLLYVDGNHAYKAARQDVNMWLPFVRQGGLIILHDSRRLPQAAPGHYARGWPGPTQVAVELAIDDRVRLVNEVHSLTAWEVL